MCYRVGRDNGQQLLLLDGVDLIDDEDCRHMMLLDLCNQALLGRADIRDGLDHQNGNVHLGNRIRHHFAHVVAQTGARLVQTRGVQQNILRFAAAEYARNARARGLRLARYDSHLLAHQLVCQRGFAHVRPSDDSNEYRGGVVMLLNGCCSTQSELLSCFYVLGYHSV